LKKMPKNAVLVNTARKEVIDEEALLKIFEERPDFRYLADVAPDCIATFEEKYVGRFIFTEKKMEPIQRKLIYMHALLLPGRLSTFSKQETKNAE